MKIGISTFHWAHNYGAMLQAYALKRFLEDKGHFVCFTDTRTIQLPSKRRVRKSIRGLSIKGIILYPKYLIKWYYPEHRVLKSRESNFERFKEKYLPQISNPDEELDMIIYGSDQIWSKFDYGFDDIFWGNDGLHTKHRIAFSASMGVVNVNEKDDDKLRHFLSKFDAVSVRENTLKSLLEDRALCPHLCVHLTLDPTFLLTKEQWEILTQKRLIKEPYLLFYDFQKNEAITEIAKKVADDKKLRIIRLSDGVENCVKDKGYFRTAGPMQFLSLIYYADFVVSSSFHGTAFSIIFEKQFFSSQYWNSDRVKELLRIAGLGSRFIQPGEDIITEVIDYSDVKRRLSGERLSSMKFINTSLSCV